MMNNVQLATTLASPTGTGKLLVPFEGGSNTAAFVESGAASNPAKLKQLRQLPKPVKDFAGVERSETRYTKVVTVNGALRTMIYSIHVSVPVDVPLADRTALFTEGALVARDPITKDLIETHRIQV